MTETNASIASAIPITQAHGGAIYDRPCSDVHIDLLKEDGDE